MVRNLISAEEARELLQQIEDWNGKAKSQSKARADKHQAAIESGDPFKYAKVAKELGQIRAEDGLGPRDKANLAQSLTLLKEEITHSLKKTSAQTELLLEKALAT